MNADDESSKKNKIVKKMRYHSGLYYKHIMIIKTIVMIQFGESF
jgi:hypothetical protein